MSKKQGSTYTTKFVFMENGVPVVRNIQRVDVQTRSGRTFSIEGKKLPGFVVLSTGRAQNAESVAQIIEDPRRTGSRPLPGLRPWPEWRDLIHVVIGLFVIGVMNFIVSLADAAF